MKGISFERMSIDELWTLQNRVAEALAARIANEKTIIEKRLSQLTQRFQTLRPRSQRSQSGRGKQRRWLTAKSFVPGSGFRTL